MNLIVRSAIKKIKWAKQIEHGGCGTILNNTEGSKGLSGEAVGLGQHGRLGAPFRHKLHTQTRSLHLRGRGKAGQEAGEARWLGLEG